MRTQCQILKTIWPYGWEQHIPFSGLRFCLLEYSCPRGRQIIYVIYLREGQFEFNWMAFGLRNSHVTYQRAVDDALMKAVNTEPFVDDTLVHSRDLRHIWRIWMMDWVVLRKRGSSLERTNASSLIPRCKFWAIWYQEWVLDHYLLRCYVLNCA